MTYTLSKPQKVLVGCGVAVFAGSVGLIGWGVLSALLGSSSPNQPGGNNDASQTTSASTSQSISQDTEAPTISSIQPVDGSTVEEEVIIVSGFVSDLNAKVTVNGQETTVGSSGKFQIGINMKVGENVIVIVATDRAGNSATERVTYIYEGQPSPELTFEQDQDIPDVPEL